MAFAAEKESCARDKGEEEKMNAEFFDAVE
jgi:hypothetical protein